MVYAKFTSPVGTSNVVLFAQDEVTVHDGWGITTLSPRADDAFSSISMSEEKQSRGYAITVSGAIIDPLYIGETEPVQTTTDDTGFNVFDPNIPLT